MKIEDIRLSSSSVDDFFNPPKSRQAGNRMRIAGLLDLAGFQFVADDKLVRLSKNDFWKLGEDENGSYIERLVDDDQGPVVEV
jgi:hypothetical protein